MDVAAAGFAASQIASAQRGQQAALGGLRGQQKQEQGVINLLSQAVDAAKSVAGIAPSAPQPAPAPDGGGNNGRGANAARGSIVNILA